MPTTSPEVRALVRRLPDLTQLELLSLIQIAGSMLQSAQPDVAALLAEAGERRAALSAIEAVARALGRDSRTAPTAAEFNANAALTAPGWNTSRVIKAFGSWSAATRAYVGKSEPLTSRQRGHLRASRKGVLREREDYLAGVRSWLSTNPPSQTAQDYDAWRLEHNATRRDGEQPVVSYSMLRKALPWSWETIKLVAAGVLAPDEAPLRSLQERRERTGPHDLVGLKAIRDLFGLGLTAARNLTYSHAFPRPAYTQPRPPGTRLWQRREIVAFHAGQPARRESTNKLQAVYLDAHAVATSLGLARITVTTRSSPRVPEPAVIVAGLQLWLKTDINAAAGSPA